MAAGTTATEGNRVEPACLLFTAGHSIDDPFCVALEIKSWSCDEWDLTRIFQCAVRRRGLSRFVVPDSRLPLFTVCDSGMRIATIIRLKHVVLVFTVRSMDPRHV